MEDWILKEGDPRKSGVTWDEKTGCYNFTLFSREATDITLLIFDDKDFINPVFKFELDHYHNKSHRVWHCTVPGERVKEGRYYAYKVGGPWEPEKGKRFDPEKILLDPFAQAVFFPPLFSRTAAKIPGSNLGKAPLGLLPSKKKPFEWGNDPRPNHTSDAIIYELHVKAFTQRENSGVSPSNQGTFEGIVEKIPYLKELGVTLVELMPVFQTDPQDPEKFWGYQPLNFFSPQLDYAESKHAEEIKNEFKLMVKALHEANIEVILDVVYNHTAEGDEFGPNYSFQGIDNTTYYLLTPDMKKYRNDAGTGNVLRCAHPYVRKLIMESMRYWVKEMHVDGFRFDLASIFARNNDGSLNLSDPAIISEISTDPDLSGIRLIAEVWDLNSFLLGRKFPGSSWQQWNAHFRDDIRKFVRGDKGMVGTLMSRIYGSCDLFPDTLEEAYRPFQSINFVNCHDGFTLYDLVSYDQRHNEVNGFNNTDGPPENFSWNCGHEGDINVPEEITKLRKQQVKNFCALLFLSNGTPMFYSGDEFMNTQQGNSNPFNQDNEITWLNWDLLEKNKDIFQFFKKMIAFRKARPSLCRSTFWREDISWYGVQGGNVDLGYDAHCLAYCLHGGKMNDKDIYVMINGGDNEVMFTVQEGTSEEWLRIVDTSRENGRDFIEEGEKIKTLNHTVKARSMGVLLRQ